MTDAVLAQTLVREIAAPAEVGEGVNQQIRRAWRRLLKHLPDLSHSRVKAFWYCEARRIEHREIKAMETVIAIRKAKQARRELHNIATRSLSFLERQDADFHRRDIDALRSALSEIGRGDRSRIDGK